MPAAPAPESAERLIGAMAEGREAALAELIARHGRGLTLFATRFLGDPALADEVAQDTFLRAWREAARYDPARGAATTWLYRIAANLCRDRLRRARLRRMLWRGPRAEDLSEVLADPAPGAAATLEGRQRLAATRQALARLPERQRLAILLTVVAGMDNAEAAAIMATSRGSVEQLLIRARRALRAGLLEGSDDDGG